MGSFDFRTIKINCKINSKWDSSFETTINRVHPSHSPTVFLEIEAFKIFCHNNTEENLNKEKIYSNPPAKI